MVIRKTGIALLSALMACFSFGKEKPRCISINLSEAGQLLEPGKISNPGEFEPPVRVCLNIDAPDTPWKNVLELLGVLCSWNVMDWRMRKGDTIIDISSHFIQDDMEVVVADFQRSARPARSVPGERVIHSRDGRRGVYTLLDWPIYALKTNKLQEQDHKAFLNRMTVLKGRPYGLRCFIEPTVPVSVVFMYLAAVNEYPGCVGVAFSYKVDFQDLSIELSPDIEVELPETSDGMWAELPDWIDLARIWIYNSLGGTKSVIQA